MDSLFNLVLSGTDVYPETLSLKMLADLFRDLEQAVAIEGDIASVDRKPLMSFAGLVQTSSAKLSFNLSTKARPVVERIATAVHTRNPSMLKSQTRKLISDFSNRLLERGVSLRFDGEGISPATINDKGDILPTGVRLTPEGVTMIYGICQWIGGNTPTAKLRLLAPLRAKVLVVKLNDVLLEEMKKHLNKEVQVEGIARWNLDDWQIARFRATSLRGAAPRQYIEGLGKLSALLGDFLQGRTPEQLVREWRDEDDLDDMS